MTIDDIIRDEKLQNDVNTETTKILALSSGKIDKYEYSRIIEQAKFACWLNLTS